MTNTEVEFVKPPLDNAVETWLDVPHRCPGRLILRQWPADTVSEGGIHLPGRDRDRIMGVAWVVRAVGEATQHFAPGDSVILPQYALLSGLQFPGRENEDIVEVEAANVYHRLPIEMAVKHIERAKAQLQADADEAIPQIKALIDGGRLDDAQVRLADFQGRTKVLKTQTVKAISTLAGDLTAAIETRRINEKAIEAAEEQAHKKRIEATRQELKNRKNTRNRRRHR